MAYIGKQPVVGNFVKLDAITTSATATYNLLNGGVAYFPQTANNCIVSLNGVIQSPTSAYTISGSTIVFSDALTASDSIDFILVLGDVLSIGTPSDGTITSAKLASGTDGLFAWQSVQTTGFTAVAARAYPCNTTSSAFTVTLPASPSVGDQVAIVDYAGTFATNNITLGRNSNKIEGGTANKLLTTNREAVTLTYVDATQGWVASSGTNYGTQSIDSIQYSADILVVAGGGGGGGSSQPGGGGAGGYRTSTQSLNGGTVYTITVGDGGTGGSSGTYEGGDGSNSSISGSGLTTITSAGGGGGGCQTVGRNGGSGGGGSRSNRAGGTGNTPSTSPSQGNNGGTGAEAASQYGAGGGGGAGAVGGNGSGGGGGNGGAGTASSITGSSITYAGGGGGGNLNTTGGTGGTGGGGNSTYNTTGGAGTTNLGGGGGGGAESIGGAGGKGVVILSVPTANYSATSTGSPTITTSGSNTILKFTGSGTYTG